MKKKVEQGPVTGDISAARTIAALQAQGADDCRDCGDTIPDDRRKAAPWAVRCVYCQEVSEVGRR